MQVGMRYGMKTMQDTVRHFASQGLISQEEANLVLTSDQDREQAITNAAAATKNTGTSPHHKKSNEF